MPCLCAAYIGNKRGRILKGAFTLCFGRDLLILTLFYTSQALFFLNISRNTGQTLFFIRFHDSQSFLSPGRAFSPISLFSPQFSTTTKKRRKKKYIYTFLLVYFADTKCCHQKKKKSAEILFSNIPIYERIISEYGSSFDRLHKII